MSIRIIIAFALTTLLFGCGEDWHCYYNCPDDPDRICGSVELDSKDEAECRALAEEKCEQNPSHLDDWDGGVVSQVIGCDKGDICGIPNWCLP